MSDAAFAIVVGAGPAGAVAARELARAGLGRVLLLDRARFPRVKPCASGLSPPAQRALQRLDLLRPVSALAYPISAAVIGAPSGRQVLLEGDVGSLVLDRSRLDSLLADEAVGAGAEFRNSVRVRRLRPGGAGGVEVVTASGERLPARHVVVATGATDTLAGQPLPATRLVTMTGWYRGAQFRDHTVELLFDRELAPHYGWLFPEAPDRVNIGLCVDARHLGGHTVRSLFDRFLQRHYRGRLAGAEPLHGPRGFPIAAAARPAVRARLPAVFVVGEAAHLASYATGEGISGALESGRLAAEAIVFGTHHRLSAPAMQERYRRGLGLHLVPGRWLSLRFAAAAPPVLELATLLGQSAHLRWVLAQVLSRI